MELMSQETYSPQEQEENPLYGVTNEVNPLYLEDIKPKGTFDTNALNVSMSFIESVNEDNNLVNLPQKLTSSANLTLAERAANEANKAREAWLESARELYASASAQGQAAGVEAAITKYKAISKDAERFNINTYANISQAAETSAEILAARQQLEALSKQTGKTQQELLDNIGEMRKGIAIRTTLENIIGSLEQRSGVMQFVQDVSGVQTIENVFRLIPVLNQKLEKYGKGRDFLGPVSESMSVTPAIQTIGSLFNSLNEEDSLSLLYDLKDTLIQAVGEKDTRIFLEKLMAGRAAIPSTLEEVGFAALAALDLTKIAPLLRGAIRGTMALAKPAKLAVQLGKKEAVAADAAQVITKGSPSVLGLTADDAFKTGVSLTDEIVPSNAPAQMQEQLKKNVDALAQELRNTLPTSGANREAIQETVRRLEISYQQGNKNIKFSEIVPDFDAARVQMQVTYGGYETSVFATKELADEFAKKLPGIVKVEESVVATETTIKTLQKQLDTEVKGLSELGYVSKREPDNVKPLTKIDAVPPSQVPRVSRLNEIIQESNNAERIGQVLTKQSKLPPTPKSIKTAKPRYGKDKVEFSSFMDKALYIIGGGSSKKRMMAGEPKFIDSETIQWVARTFNFDLKTTEGLRAFRKFVNEKRDAILDVVKKTAVTVAEDGATIRSIPAISKLPVKSLSTEEQTLLASKVKSLREKVKAQKLDTTDGTKLVQALDTEIEADAKQFSELFNNLENKQAAAGAAKITPEIQKKLDNVEELTAQLAEAKAGRLQEKGWVVKQSYSHPVFTNNDFMKFGDAELNATHGTLLATMNPALGAAESLYKASVLSVFKRSKIGRVFVDFMKDFPKLDKGEHAQLMKALVDGDALKTEFTPLELSEKFGITSDKVVKGYYQYRTVRNILHTLKDAEMVDDLTALGWKHGTIKVGDGIEPIMNHVKVIPDVSTHYNKRAFDFREGKGTTLSLEGGQSGKYADAILVELKEPYMPEGAKTAYRYALVKSDSLAVNQIKTVVNRLEGTFSRIYLDQFFIKLKSKITLDGKETDALRAFRTSESMLEADRYIDGFRALQELSKTKAVSPDDVKRLLQGVEENADDLARQFREGEFDGVTIQRDLHGSDDNFFRSTIFTGGQDKMSGQLYFSGRGEKAIPSITQKALAANIADPFTSISREIANTANYMAFNEFRRNAIEKWFNSFYDILKDKNLLEKDAESTFFRVSNELTGLKGLESARERQLWQQLKYIQNAIGTESSVERFGRTINLRVANLFEKTIDSFGAGALPGIKHTPGWLRNAEWTQWARYMATSVQLGMFTPRSWFVQAMGVLNAVTLHPVHGLRAAANIPALAFAYVNNTKSVAEGLSRTGIMQTAKMSGSELHRVASAMRKIGLLDNIGGTTINEGADATSNILRGKKAKFDTAQFFFQNSGEAINRIGAFETARRVFIANNPKAVWDSSESLAQIMNMADTYSSNMTRASEAIYQKGLLAIPFQYLQFGIKTTANVMSGFRNVLLKDKTGLRGYSPKELTAAFVFAPLIYGADNISSLDAVNQWLGEFAANWTPEQKLYMTQGMLSGIINSASLKVSGDKLELGIGTMASPYNQWELAADALWNGQFEMYDVLTGPAGGVVASALNIDKRLTVLFDAGITPENTLRTLRDMGGDIFSGMRNGTKAYIISQSENLVFDNRNQLIGEYSDSEVWAKAAGFTTSLEVAQNKGFKTKKDYSDSMQDIAKKVMFYKRLEWENSRTGNKEMAAAAFTNASALMALLPPADKENVMRMIKEVGMTPLNQRLYMDAVNSSIKYPIDPNIPTGNR